MWGCDLVHLLKGAEAIWLLRRSLPAYKGLTPVTTTDITDQLQCPYMKATIGKENMSTLWSFTGWNFTKNSVILIWHLFYIKIWTSLDMRLVGNGDQTIEHFFGHCFLPFSVWKTGFLANDSKDLSILIKVLSPSEKSVLFTEPHCRPKGCPMSLCSSESKVSAACNFEQLVWNGTLMHFGSS